MTWLEKTKKAAKKEFSNLSLPNRKVEEWHYHSAEKYYALPEKAEKDSHEFSYVSAVNIHFINGKLASPLPKGISVLPLKKALETKKISKKLWDELSQQKDKFSFYNEAYAKEGLFFELKGKLDEPIVVQYHNSSEALPLRNYFLFAANSSAEVFESFSGDAEAHSHSFFHLKAGAKCKHIRLQANRGSHYSYVKVRCDKDAKYDVIQNNFFSRFSRQNFYVELQDRGAEANAKGLSVMSEKEIVDTYLDFVHNSPQTFSDQLFKSILDDQSQATFTGKVFVAPQAELVRAEQLNKSILLSNQALINSRPQLEIYTDDVKCAHGSTTSQLSKEELFYLQSRNISTEQALKMLVTAFAEEILSETESRSVHDFVLQHFHQAVEGLDFRGVLNV